MKEELIELKDKLQLERKKLLDRLQTIDDDLESINRVLSLVDGQKAKSDSRQLELIKSNRDQPVSERFKNVTFFEAITMLFDESPGKLWKPVEIANAVLQEGFQTNSKNFKNTVRTLLMNMRKDKRINATKTKGGWLYGTIKKEPDSHTNRVGFFDVKNLNNEGPESSNHPEPS